MLTVSNAGTAAVAGVIPKLAAVSGSAYLGALAGPLPPAAAIAPGGAQAFTWTASVTAPGAVTVAAEVSGTLAGQGILVTGSASRAISAPAVARLAASLSPEPFTVTGGQWFAVVVTVSNTGGVRAAGVLPRVQAVGAPPLAAFLRGPVPAKPVALLPGESARFAFTFSANGSGTATFSVTVEGKADLSGPGVLARGATRAAEATESAATAAASGARAAIAAAKTWLFPPAKAEGPEVPFLGFESPRDAAWDTAGYASLAASRDHATEGAASLRASFLIPADLTASATGAFRPAFRRTAPARGLEPPLAPSDWSRFDAFRVDCFSLATQPLALRFALADRRGGVWEAVRMLPPASATTLEFALREARDARLDLARLAALEFSADTSALTARPVVHFDRMRFVLPPVPVSSTLVKPSATALTAR